MPDLVQAESQKQNVSQSVASLQNTSSPSTSTAEFEDNRPVVQENQDRQVMANSATPPAPSDETDTFDDISQTTSTEEDLAKKEQQANIITPDELQNLKSNKGEKKEIKFKGELTFAAKFNRFVGTESTYSVLQRKAEEFNKSEDVIQKQTLLKELKPLARTWLEKHAISQASGGKVDENEKQKRESVYKFIEQTTTNYPEVMKAYQNFQNKMEGFVSDPVSNRKVFYGLVKDYKSLIILIDVYKEKYPPGINILYVAELNQFINEENKIKKDSDLKGSDFTTGLGFSITNSKVYYDLINGSYKLTGVLGLSIEGITTASGNVSFDLNQANKIQNVEITDGKAKACIEGFTLNLEGLTYENDKLSIKKAKGDIDLLGQNIIVTAEGVSITDKTLDYEKISGTAKLIDTKLGLKVKDAKIEKEREKSTIISGDLHIDSIPWVSNVKGEVKVTFNENNAFDNMTITGGSCNAKVHGFDLNVSEFNYEKATNELKAEEASGSGKLLAAQVSLKAKKISYQENVGFDFEEASGKVEGSMAAGNFISVTNAEFNYKKGARTIVSGGLELKMESFANNASGKVKVYLDSDMNFQNVIIHEGQAKLNINSTSLELSEMSYNHQKGMFKAKSATGEVDIYGNRAKVTGTDISYSPDDKRLYMGSGSGDLTILDQNFNVNIEGLAIDKDHIGISYLDGTAAGSIQIGSFISVSAPKLLIRGGIPDIESSMSSISGALSLSLPGLDEVSGNLEVILNGQLEVQDVRITDGRLKTTIHGFDLNVSKFNYEKSTNELQAEEASGSGKLLDAPVSLNAKKISYKENVGFDFEEAFGKVEGSMAAGNFISVTNAEFHYKKGARTIVSGGLELKMESFANNASGKVKVYLDSDMNFQNVIIHEGQAKLEINSTSLELSEMSYNHQKGMFKAKSATGEVDIYGNRAKVTGTDISYSPDDKRLYMGSGSGDLTILDQNFNVNIEGLAIDKDHIGISYLDGTAAGSIQIGSFISVSAPKLLIRGGIPDIESSMSSISGALSLSLPSLDEVSGNLEVILNGQLEVQDVRITDGRLKTTIHGFDLNVSKFNYEKSTNELQAEEASGSGKLLDAPVSLNAKKISYKENVGFDFEEAFGKVEGSMAAGNFISVTNAEFHYKKGARTIVSGGLELKMESFANNASGKVKVYLDSDMNFQNVIIHEGQAKLEINSTSLELSEMSYNHQKGMFKAKSATGEVDIYGNKAKVKGTDISYSPDDKRLYMGSGSGDLTILDQNFNINIEGLAIDKDHIGISYLDGTAAGSIQIGSFFSVSAPKLLIRGGIPDIESSMSSISGALSLSLPGLDEVSGNLEVILNGQLEIQDVRITDGRLKTTIHGFDLNVSKFNYEKSTNELQAEEASGSGKLLDAPVSLNAKKISYKENVGFDFEEAFGKVEGSMAAGNFISVTNAEFHYKKGARTIVSGGLELKMESFANNASGKVKVYLDSDMNFQNVIIHEGQAKLEINSTSLELSEMSYNHQKGMFKAKSATGEVDIYGNRAKVKGTDISYSPDDKRLYMGSGSGDLTILDQNFNVNIEGLAIDKDHIGISYLDGTAAGSIQIGSFISVSAPKLLIRGGIPDIESSMSSISGALSLSLPSLDEVSGNLEVILNGQLEVQDVRITDGRLKTTIHGFDLNVSKFNYEKSTNELQAEEASGSGKLLDAPVSLNAKKISYKENVGFDFEEAFGKVEGSMAAGNFISVTNAEFHYKKGARTIVSGDLELKMESFANNASGKVKVYLDSDMNFQNVIIHEGQAKLEINSTSLELSEMSYNHQKGMFKAKSATGEVDIYGNRAKVTGTDISYSPDDKRLYMGSGSGDLTFRDQNFNVNIEGLAIDKDHIGISYLDGTAAGSIQIGSFISVSAPKLLIRGGIPDIESSMSSISGALSLSLPSLDEVSGNLEVILNGQLEVQDVRITDGRLKTTIHGFDLNVSKFNYEKSTNELQAEEASGSGKLLDAPVSLNAKKISYKENVGFDFEEAFGKVEGSMAAGNFISVTNAEFHYKKGARTIVSGGLELKMESFANNASGKVKVYLDSDMNFQNVIIHEGQAKLEINSTSLELSEMSYNHQKGMFKAKSATGEVDIYGNKAKVKGTDISYSPDDKRLYMGSGSGDLTILDQNFNINIEGLAIDKDHIGISYLDGTAAGSIQIGSFFSVSAPKLLIRGGIPDIESSMSSISGALSLSLPGLDEVSGNLEVILNGQLEIQDVLITDGRLKTTIHGFDLNVSEFNYEKATNELKAKEASGSGDFLDSAVSLKAEKISYQENVGFDFEKLTATLDKVDFGLIKVKDPKIEYKEKIFEATLKYELDKEKLPESLKDSASADGDLKVVYDPTGKSKNHYEIKTTNISLSLFKQTLTLTDANYSSDDKTFIAKEATLNVNIGIVKNKKFEGKDIKIKKGEFTFSEISLSNADKIGLGILSLTSEKYSLLYEGGKYKVQATGKVKLNLPEAFQKKSGVEFAGNVSLFLDATSPEPDFEMTEAEKTFSVANPLVELAKYFGDGWTNIRLDLGVDIPVFPGIAAVFGIYMQLLGKMPEEIEGKITLLNGGKTLDLDIGIITKLLVEGGVYGGVKAGSDLLLSLAVLLRAAAKFETDFAVGYKNEFDVGENKPKPDKELKKDEKGKKGFSYSLKGELTAGAYLDLVATAFYFFKKSFSLELATWTLGEFEFSNDKKEIPEGNEKSKFKEEELGKKVRPQALEEAKEAGMEAQKLLDIETNKRFSKDEKSETLQIIKSAEEARVTQLNHGRQKKEERKNLGEEAKNKLESGADSILDDTALIDLQFIDEFLNKRCDWEKTNNVISFFSEKLLTEQKVNSLPYRGIGYLTNTFLPKVKELSESLNTAHDFVLHYEDKIKKLEEKYNNEEVYKIRRMNLYLTYLKMKLTIFKRTNEMKRILQSDYWGDESKQKGLIETNTKIFKSNYQAFFEKYKEYEVIMKDQSKIFEITEQQHDLIRKEIVEAHQKYLLEKIK